MTVGNRSYEGMSVPLKGESQIVQETLGNDILVIEGAASQSGDFLVCRDSSETEKVYVTKDGNAVMRNLTVAGSITGTFAGAAATAYATDLAISPAISTAELSKGSAGAYTLAVPGAAYWPKFLTIYSSSAQAHVVTVDGLSGGDTLTFGGAAGDSVTLKAISATEWVMVEENNVTKSTA